MSFPNTLKEITSILKQPILLDNIARQTHQIAELIRKAKTSEKIITIFGNGGSAADSQHWAAELVCTYQSRGRVPYPAVALTTDSSIITAWSNDFHYEDVFARQIDAFSFINGLSIGLSTSGRSVNVLKGLRRAKSYAACTVLISGNSVEQSSEVDLHIRFPASDTPTIQTLTQLVYHGACDILDKLQ
jgi:D-sedoheptulose 7-phosphate isomerase